MTTSLNTFKSTFSIVGASSQTIATMPSTYSVTGNYNLSYSNGSTADTADDMVYISGSITTGSTTTIDLTNLTGPWGTVSLTGLKALIIVNLCQLDGNVIIVGAAGSNEWDGVLSNGGTITIYPSTDTNPGLCYLSMPNTTAAPVSDISKILKLSTVGDSTAAPTIPYIIALVGLH